MVAPYIVTTGARTSRGGGASSKRWPVRPTGSSARGWHFGRVDLLPPLADMRYSRPGLRDHGPLRRCWPLQRPGWRGRFERLVASFHQLHERVYGHHAVDEPTQFVNLRVEGDRAGTAAVPGVRTSHRGSDRRPTPQVYVKGVGPVEAGCSDAESPCAGAEYPRPTGRRAAGHDDMDSSGGHRRRDNTGTPRGGGTVSHRGHKHGP